MPDRHSPLRPLVVSALALAIVGGLALVVTSSNVITRADADVVMWAADWRTPLVADVARGLSLLGNVLVLGTLSAIVALAAALHRGRERLLLLPPLALAAAAIFDPLAKLAVGRPRPPAELAEVVETATGYPSGHSAQSMAFWIAFALLMASQSAWPRRWLLAGATVVMLVGASRVVLGVHSPTDVIGGWSLGLACVLLTRAALSAQEREKPRDSEA